MNITTPLNRLAALCLFILCAAAPAPAAPPDPTQVMQLDGMRVAVGPHGVLEIAADGVVFSRAAQLWLVNPTWTDHHYSFDMDTTLGATLRRSDLPGGGQRVEFDMRAPTGEWRGTKRVDLLPGRVVRVAVDAQLTTDMPDAVMEHQLGEIVPGWLTGRPMEVTDAGGAVTQGTVPGAAKSDETKKNILASGFRRLALDTRAGKVEIATTGSAPMTLIDHRRNPAAMGKMVFWFGVFDIPVRPWEKLSYAVDFRFPPAVKRADAPAARVAAKPRAVDAALRPQSVPDRVIPTPKRMEWRRGDLSLAAGAMVSVNADGAAEKAFAGEIAAQLRDELKLKHGTGSAEAGKPGAEIELRIAPAARGAEPHGPEEYRVEVGRRAVLEAQTTAGLANAWKTLRQLVRSGDGSPARIRRCTVHDWPSLDFRGVLFFTGRDAGADQAKLVRDILGAMKINFLLYHVNMAEWELASGAAKPLHRHEPQRGKQGDRRVPPPAGGDHPVRARLRPQGVDPLRRHVAPAGGPAAQVKAARRGRAERGA